MMFGMLKQQEQKKSSKALEGRILKGSAFVGVVRKNTAAGVEALFHTESTLARVRH